MELTRRGLILSLASVMAAPAIVRASNLMPIKAYTSKHWILTGYDAWGNGVTEVIELPVGFREMVYGDIFMKEGLVSGVYIGKSCGGMLCPVVKRSHLTVIPSYDGTQRMICPDPRPDINIV